MISYKKIGQTVQIRTKMDPGAFLYESETKKKKGDGNSKKWERRV